LEDEDIAVFDTALTASRNFFLSATGVYEGAQVRVVRSANATGAFNVDVKDASTIRLLANAGEWVLCRYVSGAWVAIGQG